MSWLVEGLSVAVIGILIVFTVLFLISLMIGMFKNIFSDKGEEDKKKIDTPVSAPVEVKTTDDLELIAVITAAIAASLNTSADNLQVRSIKKIYPWIEAESVFPK